MTAYLIHAANVLYLFSYLVRDILWLRVLTVVAASTLIPYFHTEGLLAPIVWNLLFTSINLYQIYRLLLERRPVRLEAKEERLFHLAFRTLTPREFMKLASIGEWVRVEGGDEIVSAGAPVTRLQCLYEGQASVLVKGKTVATLNPGCFIGEMSYLTGDSASATVTSEGRAELMCWDRERLEAFLAKHDPIRGALQLVLGTDLATKIRQGHDAQRATG